MSGRLGQGSQEVGEIVQKPIKVLILPRYHIAGASSRIRIYQYLEMLKAQGFDPTVLPFFWENYQQDLYEGRRPKMVSLCRAYWHRLKSVLAARNYDLVWLEYEVLPWLPAWCEQWLRTQGVPFLVDYDDAIFHRYDQNRHFWVRHLLGGKIDCIMRMAEIVMVGNSYLAGRATVAGATRVELLPSVVDAERYRPRLTIPRSERPVIGWIGSPSTARYLRLIQGALAEVSRLRQVRLVFVGCGRLEFAGLSVESIPWSEASEIEFLQSIDIGIMPLPDEPWERGKCGFKLIQYMACAVPVVASPVGVNRELVRTDSNGYLAESEEEWVAVLLRLIDSPQLRQSLGKTGRKLVEERYCTAKVAEQLSGLLRAATHKDHPCAG
jgi:glycosyltransferase involved in cell wall biosynthesis